MASFRFRKGTTEIFSPPPAKPTPTSVLLRRALSLFSKAMNFDRMASSPAPASPYAEEQRGSTAVARSARPRRVNPDVSAVFFQSSVRRRGPRKPPPARQQPQCARYGCAFEEEEAACGGKLSTASRLVWAKVKTHPWLPAQVFDAADASELALRHRGRHGATTTTLVAFFWDMTFAWADAASLRPFRDGFPLLAGNGQITVACAVDAALAEVARRVAAGLSCACCRPGEKQLEQVVANAGVREDARGAVVDAGFARAAFRGEAFVEYVSALAVAPGAGADRLELTVAMAQLRAFKRWRSPSLPEYTAAFGIVDDGAMEAARATPASRATTTTPKRRRRRRRARRGGGAAAVDDSGGNLATTMSRCARGTTPATMTRDDRGKALVDYVLAMPAGAAAGTGAAAAELEAFTQWRRAPSRLTGNGATPPARRTTTKETGGSIGGDDAAAADGRAGAWRMTSCIRPAACEIDDHDREEALDDDLEPFSPHRPSSPQVSSRMASSKLGWKDCVIVMQFLAIVLLLCKLTQSH